MPDSKITALASIGTGTDPANDPLVIVDVSDVAPGGMSATGTTKKVTLNQLLATSPTATLASATITGDLTVDTSTLKVDSTNNRVGIGTASPTVVADFLSTVIGNSNVLTIGNNEYGGATYLSSNSVSLAFNRGQSFKTGAIVSSNTTNGNLSEGYIAFQTSTSNVLTERYRIDNTGVSTWSVGGSTAMTLNSTGLGLGSTPLYKFHIAESKVGETNIFVDNQQNDPAALSGLWLSAYGGTWKISVPRSATFVNPLIFKFGSTEVARMTSVGDIVLAGGNTSANGVGITFPATQVASSDVNTLDDYEEGSWVPTLNSGTFSSASCRYTKVGNMVTIFFDVTVGTGGGDRITNLPFAAASTSTVANGIYTNNQTYAAGTTAPVVVVGGSSSTLFFRTVGTGVAFSAMTLTAAANLTGSISYFV